MRFLPAAAALCAALTLAGCSSSTSGEPSGSALPSLSSGSPTTSVPPPSSSIPTTTTSTSPPATSTSAAPGALAPTLLTAAEVGPGFRATPASANSDPLPCTPHRPPLEQQVPSSDKAKVLFGNRAGTLALQENVLAYSDPATAAKALATAKVGLSCPTATSNGAKLQITGPVDVHSQLTAKVTTALAWVVKSPKFQGSIIVIRIGEKLVTLQFAATSKRVASSVDGRQITETAVAKVINGA